MVLTSEAQAVREAQKDVNVFFSFAEVLCRSF